MPSRPDLSVIVALGLGVSQVSSSKKDKKLALDPKCLEVIFWHISDASTHRSRALGLILVW